MKIPERWIESSENQKQHQKIMDGFGRLLLVIDGGCGEAMAKQFTDFCALVVAHFADEEAILASLGSDMLSIQQAEHGILSRMLTNMHGLMATSDQVPWRSTVIGEAIDALALHFVKEEEIFTPLIGRRRR